MSTPAIISSSFAPPSSVTPIIISTVTTTSNNINGNVYLIESDTNGKMSLKNDTKNIINDEETTTDWTPEIPFKNVIIYIIYL